MKATLTLRGETALGTGSTAANVVHTKSHIPGAVLRGAMAAAWIRQYGDPDSTFDTLFEGGVRFGPLYAGQPPLPLSLLVHKRGHDNERCARSAWDLAVESAGELPVCPDCSGQLEMSKGQLPTTPVTRAVTHVELNSSETAAKGKLFTRQVLVGGGQTFVGSVDGPDDLLAQLANLSQLRLGGRRSTGQGAAALSLTNASDAPLTTRRADDCLVVRLISPAVFVDGWGRPHRTPDLDDLRACLGVDVEILESWTRWTTVGGWHVASGLPKPVDVAVEAGSTFVLKPSEPVTDEALLALERRGLGLRRHEGFGALGPAPEIAATARALYALTSGNTRTIFPLKGVHPDLFARIMEELRALATLRRKFPGTAVSPNTTVAQYAVHPNTVADYRAACELLLGIQDGALLDAHLDRLEAGK